MDVQNLLSGARDALTVRRVFGEPYEKNGVTVIGVAAIRGGGGGGSGSDGQPEQGAGAGFGLTARPVGAYVIQDGTASWQPSIDVTRIVVGGQVVAVVGLLVLRSLLRQRAKTKRVKVRKST